MLGGIEDFDSHDSVAFPDVQYDILGGPSVNDFLLPLIESDVEKVCLVL